MDNLTEIFCLIDDFCREFEPAFEQQLLTDGQKKRRRACALSLSELMTLAVLFHVLRFRQFKAFYLGHACRYLRAEFPHLPSYSRCVELLPRCVVPLTALFLVLRGECDGLSIIDSTALPVCHNRRISSHKTFAGHAERGKTSTGWFFGFKLHLIINSRGRIASYPAHPRQYR